MLRPAWAIALTCVACRSPTQITVIVTTDVDCSKLGGTSIATGRLDEFPGKPPAATATRCDRVTGELGTLVVVPSGAKDEEVALRIVTGVGKDPEACSGVPGDTCIVAKRALRFIPHEELVMRVVMRSSCLGKPCATDETCVQGNCVKAKIGQSSACAGSGCDETALLPSSDAGVGDAVPETIIPPKPGWMLIADPPAALESRVGHTAVWTGSEMIVWGGNNDTIYYSDGASYDPSTNKWTMLPDSGLAPRSNHTAVWTGSEMIVWGGINLDVVADDHASYDPKTGTWTKLPVAPIGPRYDHVAVYATTTNEMIVWGGAGTPALSNGAALNLKATPPWRTLEPSPLNGRGPAGAVWNGTSMVVFGGVGPAPYGDAASYDPVAKKWTKQLDPPAPIDPRNPQVAVAVPSSSTSQTVAFFGGIGSGAPRDNGVAWNDPTWTLIAAPPASALPTPGRTGPSGFASPGRLWIWGGWALDGTYPVTGASYDFGAKTWSAMPSGTLGGRANATAVWTGTMAIVWGGSNCKPQRDGAIFRP
jgi:hypothetical protein